MNTKKCRACGKEKTLGAFAPRIQTCTYCYRTKYTQEYSDICDHKLASFGNELQRFLTVMP